MPDEKKILLTIKGVQMSADGEKSEIEFITEGQLRTEGGGTQLSYLESEIVGTNGAVTTIDICGDMVKILRTGTFGANFEFVRGRKCLSLYTTPYGVMEMGAYPTVVSYGLCEGAGEIELSYEMEVQGQFIGSNHLLVKWRENPRIC